MAFVVFGTAYLTFHHPCQMCMMSAIEEAVAIGHRTTILLSLLFLVFYFFGFLFPSIVHK
jgi:hypothetical protein